MRLEERWKSSGTASRQYAARVHTATRGGHNRDTAWAAWLKVASRRSDITQPQRPPQSNVISEVIGVAAI